MFVAAGFAAANGDLPVSGVAKERKSTYAAAEAGLNYYLNQPAAGPGLLDQVRHGPGPERRPSSTRSTSSGTAAGADPRRWRNDPRRRPTSTRSSCCPTAGLHRSATPTQQAGLDRSTCPPARSRSASPAAPTSDAKRSAQHHRDVPPRQLPELRLLHRLREPRPAGRAGRQRRAPTSRPTAPTSTARRATGKGCPEIQFATGDEINGPLHTNDENLLICGTPTFGRTNDQDGARRPPRPTRSRCAAAAPGHVPNPNGSAAATRRRSTRRPASSRPTRSRCALPESNAALQSGRRVNGGEPLHGQDDHPPQAAR